MAEVVLRIPFGLVGTGGLEYWAGWSIHPIHEALGITPDDHIRIVHER